MNWFNKATAGMSLNWNTAYKELKEGLGREPTTEEVQKKIFESEWESPLDGDIKNIPLL